MINELEQLYSMLGVTDQVQAGERIGFLVGQSIMLPKLEAKVAELEAEVKDADGLSKILGDLLREIDITIRGPEPALTQSGYPDLPQRVKTLVEERNDAQARAAELEKQEPVAHLRASDLERLRKPGVAGCGAALENEPRDGFVPVYLAPVAQAGQVPEEVRILLARAQGQIEHLAEYTENLGEDLEEGEDVSEDVAEARGLAEEIGAYLAAAPAQGGE